MEQNQLNLYLLNVFDSQILTNVGLIKTFAALDTVKTHWDRSCAAVMMDSQCVQNWDPLVRMRMNVS